MTSKVKILLVWLLAAALLFGHGLLKFNSAGMKSGMQVDAVLTEHPDSLRGNGYIFTKNAIGNFVVAKTQDGVVTQVQVVDAAFANPSSMRFKQVKEGMSPSQVSAMVGLPLRFNAEEKKATVYIAENGTVYAVGWKIDDQTGNAVCTGYTMNAYASEVKEKEALAADVRYMPSVLLVPKLHNALDGMVIWAAILLTTWLKEARKEEETGC